MLELLAGCGVRYLFGNPGTTELPLMDALVRQDRVQYVLALQEVPAMAIADGYAQAAGSPGVVNLHICCGLGNAMGMLYNAFREGTPLVVTAGQQDQRMAFEEPILWGDMVAAVRPWTKWAAEVTRVEDLPAAVRRAMQTAMTPPTGPVFLALPLDVQMAEAKLDLTPPRLPDPHIRPAAEAVRRAAAVLAAAENPGILVGSRICEADAVERAGGRGRAAGRPGDARGIDLARAVQLPFDPSAGRAADSVLVARGPRAAGGVRRGAGGRDEALSAVHLPRAAAAHPRARAPGADRRQPVGAGQELPAGGGGLGASQAGPGGVGGHVGRR